jgi:hypothetical protein
MGKKLPHMMMGGTSNQSGIITVNMANRLTRNLKTSQELFEGAQAKIKEKINYSPKIYI